MRKFTTSEKPPVQPIVFELDGREMTFTPAGWAPVMNAAEGFNQDDPIGALGSLRQLLDWLGAGLGDEDGTHFLARLNDPGDPFDLDDAVAVMLGILEEVIARPTKPSSDSSPSLEATGSTAGRHLETSTPQS